MEMPTLAPSSREDPDGRSTPPAFPAELRLRTRTVRRPRAPWDLAAASDGRTRPAAASPGSFDRPTDLSRIDSRAIPGKSGRSRVRAGPDGGELRGSRSDRGDPLGSQPAGYRVDRAIGSSFLRSAGGGRSKRQRSDLRASDRGRSGDRPSRLFDGARLGRPSGSDRALRFELRHPGSVGSQGAVRSGFAGDGRPGSDFSSSRGSRRSTRSASPGRSIRTVAPVSSERPDW